MDWLLVAGSLAGVLALAAAAWLLGLGGGTITGEAEAMREAEDALSGFRAARALVSRDRRAALVRGIDGELALLKVHGVHVAVRRLQPPVEVKDEGETVRVATGEAMFGAVRLRLDPQDRDKLRTML
jgi:hypothetical protein